MNMKKNKYNTVYLASGRDFLCFDNILYNDLFIKRDLVCDMLEVDLNSFDIVLASPPCNYYSRANYRRDISSYSLNTRHLLPCILNKLAFSDKFFIVENVKNYNLFNKLGLINLPNVYFFTFGRHSFWTNVFSFEAYLSSYFHIYNTSCNISYLPSYKRQGDKAVSFVFNCFIEFLNLYN